ncbi:hypothetical protein [Streptomyces sp. CNQ085]|uniref:hypothetical protein n=1 Tax=Streptomyces sp. CNQ085 TaxID=2886944 RepID=UPI001F512775|nr:hypothetical protein [Streptomyces sp. CNQ085]MCI0386121.1 hypothetical protein [Streptomyces sp. CNQ085]
MAAVLMGATALTAPAAASSSGNGDLPASSQQVVAEAERLAAARVSALDRKLAEAPRFKRGVGTRTTSITEVKDNPEALKEARTQDVSVQACKWAKITMWRSNVSNSKIWRFPYVWTGATAATG